MVSVSSRPVWAVILVALTLLASSGCDGRYATYRIADWPDDDPLKPTAQAVALERYATAAAAESIAEQAQATRQAADAQAQQQYRYMTAVAQATEDAHRREMEQQRRWATQQAANATQVAQATEMAISVEMTTQAMAMQATAEAYSLAATATAQYKAYMATLTRQAWEARTTATAEAHTATAVAVHATMTRQAEKREEVLGYGRDYGIPVVLLLLGAGMIAFLVYAARQYAGRPIVYPRNILGDADPLAVPVKGGGYTFVDLDRQPGPALTALPDGTVQAPQLRSAGQEERTTARDQLVDAMARPKLGAGQKAQTPALPMAPPPTPPAPGLRSVRILRRLDQAERAGFLPPPLVAALAADWEEEQ